MTMILKLLLFHLTSILWLLNPVLAASPSMVMPGCRYACGNVTIPYPFGIGEGCYLSKWYAITCNDSLNKPFLNMFDLEVLRVSFEEQTLTFNTAIASNCPNDHGTINTFTSTNFSGSPFTFSSRYNEFAVVGCDNALLNTYGDEVMAGCTSTCIFNTRTAQTKGGCYGINCCKTSIPSNLDFYSMFIHFGGSTINSTSDCSSAFLVETGWFQGNLSLPGDTPYAELVPVALHWKISNLSGIKQGHFPDYFCDYSQETNYSCSCQSNYQGNPYIPHGCKVVEACANCKGECSKQYQGETEQFYCKSSNKTEIILGSSLGGGLLIILLGGVIFLLYKLMKRRRLMKLKQKFFKRNGGLLLQQQISSDEDIVEKTVVFTSKELEKATDNFNENRILGQGGQGTVYKGMLIDGKIVAIKKSKVVDESQLQQFINEVFILSQIKHRNIVKLIGCCLEIEVPLLIYEFISNGNLFQLIHHENEEWPISWNMRIQIATEVAGALAYQHSASAIPIYHRDIKSTNILLDEKLRAKVADFGTSRSIAIDQTHLTTVVQGTFGYLDPEYFQSSQFTDKSDVYSFGVVLVELLTGQKAISSLRSEHDRSLATRFNLSLEESRLFDILDSRVIEEASNEEVIAVANIARRCLRLNGKRRPTMKEVMMELEGIRMSHMPSTATEKFNEDEFITEMKESPDDALTSTQSSRNYQRVFSDVDPLLLRTI